MKTMSTVKPHSRGSRSRSVGAGTEGSALLTAIIFSFVVMMVLGGYLYLSSTEYRLSTRSYLFGASFNLAEGGVDLGLDALKAENNGSGWTKGTASDGQQFWARSFLDYDLGGNIKGDIKVVILNALTSAPDIYSEGIARGHLAGNMSKQLRVELSRGFHPYLNGFESKNGIVLRGNNVTMDSYDSRVGPYGPGNINSNITVSTISIESDAVDVGNADVYGYVATGGEPPDVGPHGSITTYDNPGVVDESRITMDYYAEFPHVSAPTLSSPSNVFPSSGTVTPGNYLIGNWSSNSSSPIVITGHTTVVSTGTMSLSGNGAIQIADGASLTIFVQGNVSFAGNGVLNMSAVPKNLTIFGTNSTPGAQTISVSGNGFLAGTVYAPNANINVNGGGTSGRILGAVVGYDSKIVGNSHFSYDEALADFKVDLAGYSVEDWVEVTGVSMSSAKLNMEDFGL